MSLTAPSSSTSRCPDRTIRSSASRARRPKSRRVKRSTKPANLANFWGVPFIYGLPGLGADYDLLSLGPTAKREANDSTRTSRRPQAHPWSPPGSTTRRPARSTSPSTLTPWTLHSAHAGIPMSAPLPSARKFRPSPLASCWAIKTSQSSCLAWRAKTSEYCIDVGIQRPLPNWRTQRRRYCLRLLALDNAFIARPRRPPPVAFGHPKACTSTRWVADSMLCGTRAGLVAEIAPPSGDGLCDNHDPHLVPPEDPRRNPRSRSCRGFRQSLSTERRR